jgi:transposase
MFVGTETAARRICACSRFLLRLHVEQLTTLDKVMASLDAEVERLLEPFRRNIEILKTIPGVSDTVAQVIVAEIGFDMSRFQTPGHLISWAGMCSRNDESAGKLGVDVKLPPAASGSANSLSGPLLGLKPVA